MYIASGLIKQVSEAGATAAKRTKGIAVEDLWRELEQLRKSQLESLLPEALTANFNVAVPLWDRPGDKRPASGEPLSVVGIDGSQVYPRLDVIQMGYVSAVAYPQKGKPIYCSDFVDLIALRNREIDRPELRRLLSIAGSPASFVDLWRGVLELDMAWTAAAHFPFALILMDGPLLPPKTKSIENKTLIDRWTEWLQNYKSAGYRVAGIVSGPSSRLLASAIHLAKSESVWKARHQKGEVSDRDLMRYGLSLGERSAIFGYGSRRDQPLRERGLGIDFFYLKTACEEIARVEIPQWISQNESAINAIHASVLADSQPLGGYSFVLTAAHSDIAIPAALSNDLHERAYLAYLENGGSFVLSAKQRMKLQRRNL